MEKKKFIYIINQDATIKDALIEIEKNKHRSLIVVDDDNLVKGTLSDGDIRKGLINNIVQSASVKKVMNYDFKYLTENKIDQARKFMEKHNIFLIPIIDKDNKLIDVIERY